MVSRFTSWCFYGSLANMRQRHYVFGYAFRPSAVRPLTSRETIFLYFEEGFQWNVSQVAYSSREWELLKKSGQRHEPTECHDGGGMHFDGMASRLTC